MQPVLAPSPGPEDEAQRIGASAPDSASSLTKSTGGSGAPAVAAACREKAIIEAALDGIVTIDFAGNVIEWNPAATTIFGWTAAEVLGKPLAELIIPPPFREAHRLGIARFKQDGEGPILRQRLELPALRKDGTEILVEIMITDIRSGDEVVFTGFIRDVTSSRRASEALESAKLEAEKAKRDAEQANLSKSEFLSRMSHELRTPLNAILGFGQLLQVAPIPPTSRQHVDQILKGGRHLLDLINEILDTARIEAGQLSLSLEPIAARRVVTEVFDLIRPLADQYGIHLVDHAVPAADIWVKADLQRLRQILLNLLSNAVKYNRPNGRVWLEVSVAGENAVSFAVHDSGHGISPGKMDRLFIPFERLGAESSGIEGTGIGLALSKRLAELMNGTLEASSEEQTGSVFTLTLPLSQSMGGEEAPTVTVEAPVVNDELRWPVLYIEDHESNVQLMQGIFSLRPDLDLLIAGTGPEGLKMARVSRPSVILLDLHLPGMSGQEVLGELKADSSLLDIPVIIVSADASQRNQDDLLSRGAAAFLTKPVDIALLLEALREHLPGSG